MEWLMFVIGGAAIGIISGFFGVGGGIILTPVLLVLDYEPTQAIILSLMLTLGSTVTGTLSHMKMKNVNIRSACSLGLFGVIGTVSTVPFVHWLEKINGASTVISVVYIITLSWFASQFLNNSQSVRKERRKSWIPLIGLFTGVLSSLMGVSGGFVMTPLLTKKVGIDLNRAIGTSIAAASIIVISGIGSYVYGGAEMDYRHGLLLIVGALIGTPFGIINLKKFSEIMVKEMLAVFYVVVALSVVFKMLSLTMLSLGLLLSAVGLFFIVLFYNKASRLL
ncbi:sulfite exporter TauE/SafE family protein [Fictibacillus phosphorivorans]|uniref:sulfite exporter TauE/SafE family protein n=1 Tax=Fictibacillus phosphorivorans TaxID=1221500 RepID=UPI00119D50A5|nr:sulfite exporter TauE/SafE family protein [Fictibacillus phosphorivorans]